MIAIIDPMWMSFPFHLFQVLSILGMLVFYLYLTINTVKSSKKDIINHLDLTKQIVNMRSKELQDRLDEIDKKLESKQ